MRQNTLRCVWSNGITLKLAEIMFRFVTVRQLRNGGREYGLPYRRLPPTSLSVGKINHQDPQLSVMSLDHFYRLF
jgi:hypothetical protein